jgi:hypothetical protein
MLTRTGDSPRFQVNGLSKVRKLGEHLRSFQVRTSLFRAFWVSVDLFEWKWHSPFGKIEFPNERSILHSGKSQFQTKDRFSVQENRNSKRKIDSPFRKIAIPNERSILRSGKSQFQTKDRFSVQENRNSIRKIDSPFREITIPNERSILRSGESHSIRKINFQFRKANF